MQPPSFDDLITTNWRHSTLQGPHEYCLKQDNPELFEEVLRRLREEGYIDEFNGRKYRYYWYGSYRYWVMAPVINRAKAPIPVRAHLRSAIFKLSKLTLLCEDNVTYKIC